jgi:hypothetical protein
MAALSMEMLKSTARWVRETNESFAKLRNDLLPPGTVVQQPSLPFGFGIVAVTGEGCPPDRIAVKKESGVVLWMRVEELEPCEDQSQWPWWVNRAKGIQQTEERGDDDDRCGNTAD